MKRLCIFTILAAAALTACVKENAPAPVSEIEDTVDEVISFDFSVRPMADADDDAGTKALVSASGLLSSGNQIKVYDVFKGTTSTAEYFNTILTSNGSGWGTEDEYKWTRTGTHNFFGWFLKDASGNNTDFASLFGSASYSDYTLTLPAVEMTASTPQFDFLYSDVIQKNRGDGSSDPTESSISLQMKHLFTAFSLGVKNNSEIQTITIKKVEVRNLANKKSATLAFNITGENTTITPNFTTYSDGHTTNPDFSYTGQFTVGPGASLANILSSNSSNELCYLMWPQTADELDDAEVYIEYERNGNAQEPATFKIPQTTWDAGKINHIDATFYTEPIQLYMSDILVNEGQFRMTFSWDAVENAIGYSIRVINNNNGSVDTDWTTIYNTSYEVGGLNNDSQSRTIYVKAIGDGSNYLASEAKSQTGVTSPEKREKVDTPKITKFEFNNGSITVGWDKISESSKYQAKLYVWQNGDWSYKEEQITEWETEFTFTGLDQSKDYKIELVAIPYNDTYYGDSDPAVRTTKDKAEPTKLVMGNVTCTEKGQNYLIFNWNYVNGAQSYEVGKDKGNGGKEWMNIGNSTSFRWEDREPDTSYTIYVRAIGDGTNYLTSDASNCIAKTSSSNQLVIGAVTCTERGRDYLTFRWDAVNGAQSYEVGWANGTWSNIGNATSFTWQGLNDSSSYTIYVRAIGDGYNHTTSAPSTCTALTLKKAILWTNDGRYGDPHGTYTPENGYQPYRFSLQGTWDGHSITTFDPTTWNLFKTNTFYAEVSLANGSTSFEIFINTGWNDGFWYNGNITPNSAISHNNNNGTYYIEINLKENNQAVYNNMDEHNLLISGNGFILNRLYYYE